MPKRAFFLISEKIFFCETGRPRAVIFGIWQHLECLHIYCWKNLHGGKKWPHHRGQRFYIEIYRETFKNLLLQNHQAESFHIWYMATSRRPLHILLKESPWGQKWPRPRGQKFGIEIYWETFKNLLLHNHKAESFHIWYMATSRGPLHILLKDSLWGQKWHRPRGHVF